MPKEYLDQITSDFVAITIRKNLSPYTENTGNSYRIKHKYDRMVLRRGRAVAPDSHALPIVGGLDRRRAATPCRSSSALFAGTCF
jgi:hypothetical protein